MTPLLYFNNESFKLILFARGRRRAVHELKARIDYVSFRAHCVYACTPSAIHYQFYTIQYKSRMGHFNFYAPRNDTSFFSASFFPIPHSRTHSPDILACGTRQYNA